MLTKSFGKIIIPLRKGTLILILTIVPILLGCKKLVEVNSPTSNITGDNVFTNDGTAAAVLTGIYTTMSSSSLISGDLVSIGFLTGLAGDELSLQIRTDIDLSNYYINKLNPQVQYSPWMTLYTKMFMINSVIEKVPASQSLSAGVKKQLLGEAKFMRAFIYFYLINLYGDVPLVVTTDYAANSVLPRTPAGQVWSQIISDLNDAKELLTENYLDGTLLITTQERVRPNKWAAIALLARCYLYTHDWKNAEIQCTQVINNTSLYHLDSLNNVFLKNSWEAIWQLQPVNFGSNTEEAKMYNLASTGLTYSKPVSLSTQLYSNFEINDQRKFKWMDSIIINGIAYYFASKYKSDSLNAPVTEYCTVLRLSEQYLIRAEARAQQNNLNGSLDDLNAIRQRAWLNKSQVNTKDSILTKIYHERRVEFFTEWGHRWLDLKRTQLINSIMAETTPRKGGTWSINWQFFPIPVTDILFDANILQNSGY